MSVEFPDAIGRVQSSAPVGIDDDADCYAVVESADGEWRTITAITRDSRTNATVTTYRCRGDECLRDGSFWWRLDADESLATLADRLARPRSCKLKRTKHVHEGDWFDTDDGPASSASSSALGRARDRLRAMV